MLAWLGWNAWPIARIGDDFPGSFVRREMESLSVDWSHVSHTANAGTPTIIQEFTRDAKGNLTHRFRVACPTCRVFLPRFTPPTVAVTIAALNQMTSVPRVLYFDRACPASIRAAEWIRERGGLTIFEPSGLGDPSLFKRALVSANIVKYSSDHRHKFGDTVQCNPPQVEIETLGNAGVRFRTCHRKRVSRWYDQQAFDLPRLSDTAGAGDACTAGLVHALIADSRSKVDLSIRSVSSALRFGQAMASLNCGFIGARGYMNSMTARQAILMARRMMESGVISNLPSDTFGTQAQSSELLLQLCDSCRD